MSGLPLAATRVAPPSLGRLLQLSLGQLVEGDSTFCFRAALRFGDLAQSIRDEGQQVPIIVRPVAGGSERYQLISGFRRCNAIRDIGTS